jgi:hypothetical protein
MHGGNRRRMKFLLIPCYGSAPVVGVIRNLPDEEWVVECAPGRIAQMLNDRAKAVRDEVKSGVEAGRDTSLHYDHPIPPLQHMLWHEGNHHGQMKLGLKVAGRPMTDEEAGTVTWDVWMRKR